MPKRARDWRAPRCSSGKHTFRTQGVAIYAAQQLVREDVQAAVPMSSRPVGVYRCRECRCWHMTSSVGGTTVLLPG